MSGLQRDVGEWAEATFTRATTESILEHLSREADELRLACRFPAGDDPAEEAADIVLLLLHLAHRQGWDLDAAVRAKFAVNRRRRWGEPDAEGVVEHER